MNPTCRYCGDDAEVQLRMYQEGALDLCFAHARDVAGQIAEALARTGERYRERFRSAERAASHLAEKMTTVAER